MNDLEQGKNTGVIIVDPRPTDFVSGAETGIVYEARVADGNWEPYKPTDEWQRKLLNGILGYDTESCVTFSALNVVETQVYFLMQNGLLTVDQMNVLSLGGYIDDNGRPNFSDWFTAVMSGTTVNGNSQPAVWDSIRKDGLLPQKDGFSVNDFNSVEDWLAAKPTADQIAKAKNILGIIQIAYEWTISNPSGGDNTVMGIQLKQAPLHILTPTGGNWNTTPPGIIADPNMRSVNHATTLIGQVVGQYNKDLDHYNPFVKYLAPNYYIPYVIKAVVTASKPVQDEWSNFTYTFNINIYAPAKEDAPDLHNLQRALQKLGYMKKGVYGPMGPQTTSGLAKFQTDNGIIDDGTHFGPKTRAAMNLKLNQ